MNLPGLLADDDTQITRLVELAQIWGVVKYFHPFLAYREIDWDQALIEVIPKVKAVQTPQDYQAAVNQMLSVLGDHAIYAEIAADINPIQSQQPVVSAKELVRTEDGVLVIEAMEIAKTIAQNRSALDSLMAKIREDFPTAKAIVIDGRGDGQCNVSAYSFNNLMRQILPQVLDTNVMLGSIRYRMHNGYPSQVGRESGGYYSAFVNVAPETMIGRNPLKAPPIVFIINGSTPDLTSLLSGLQAANCAFVVQEGEQMQESGDFMMRLSDGVNVRIRTNEPVHPNGSVGFQADAVVPKSREDAAMREAMQAAREHKKGQHFENTTTFTPQVSQQEKAYAQMEFPSTEYRLLALFRFWNIINYFFPYKDLISDSWETVLPRYISKFKGNRDAADYQLTVREMVAEIHDSHGGVYNVNAAAERLGKYLPPILVRYIENQSVVTQVVDDHLPVKVGDVILSIDGESVETRCEFLSHFIAASTPQSLMNQVRWNLLRGQQDSVAKLGVRGMDGEVREVEISRSVPIYAPELFAAEKRSLPVVQVLPSGYGYVDLARLQVGEVDPMFETLKTTPAIIFDMRGYPHGTAWVIAPRLTEKNMPVAALFSRPLLEGTSLNEFGLVESANYRFVQRLPERNGDVYKGKVVVLINEEAISQAEHTCMFFEAATDVTFIGTPTAGANGDVTVMILPGGLRVSFTGHNVRHADGRQLQRVGIQPTITAAPTIGGISAGRDEILETAIKYLRENISK